MSEFKIEPFIVNSSTSEYLKYDDFNVEKDDFGGKKFVDKNEQTFYSFVGAFANENGIAKSVECFKIDNDTFVDLKGNVLDKNGNVQPVLRGTFSDRELEENSVKFLRTNNGLKLDEYLERYPNSRSLEENKQLYSHLSEIKDASENDSNFSQKTKISFTNEDNEMFLGIAMMLNGRESPFQFFVKDGKVVFPDGASPAERKEMMAFLRARGISGLDLPDDLLEIQKNIDHELISQDKLDNPEKLDELPEKSSSPVPAKEIKFKDVEDNMKGWCERNGKREGYSYFHTGGILTSWNTWTIFASENSSNMSNLGKQDKDGNLKANFEAQISARIKNGRLEVRYCLPPAGKMTAMVAEQIVELHAMNGAKKIRFVGICDHDLKEIRTACAKKLVVPVGIGLKVSAAQDMITEARKNHDIGPEILDYERRLAEQIRQNAENKGKSMSATESKFYKDTMEKVSIATYSNLFSSDRGINARLVGVDYNGNDISKVMASRYAAADVYQLYSRVATSGNQSVSGIAEALHEINSRLGIEANTQEQYQTFLSKAKLKGTENITKLTPEQMGALYDSIYESRREMSKKRMLELHEDSSQNKSDNFDGLIKKGLSEAQKYFDANFTKQYSGIMDKAYPIFPSNNDGLKFGPTEEMVKASKEKKYQPENGNKQENNQKKESENQGRKESFNDRKNTFSKEKMSNQTVAEQLVELHAMNGAKSINFEAKPDLDVKTLKTACADNLIVPTGGVELDVTAAREMLGRAQETRGSDPKALLDFQKRLAIQVRLNAEKEGRMMDPAEMGFYRETVKKIEENNKNVHGNTQQAADSHKKNQKTEQQPVLAQKTRD